MFAETGLDVGHFMQAWLVPVIAVNVYVHWYMVKALSASVKGKRTLGGQDKPPANRTGDTQTIIVAGSGGPWAGA